MAEVFWRNPKSTGTDANSTVVRDANGEIEGVWDAVGIGTLDLDTFLTQGIYVQVTFANAITSKHYPEEGTAGLLEVITYEGATAKMQRYTARDGGKIWTRYWNGTAWNPWAQIGTLATPTGVVQLFAGTGSTPGGWLVCNGSAVSRTTYAELFTVIGTTYGVGDGSTTFNLPNTVNRFVEGSTVPGSSGGSGTHTHGLTAAVADLRMATSGTELHGRNRSSPSSRTLDRRFTATGASMAAEDNVSGVGIALTGSTDAQSSLPPYVDLIYIIKT
jgi:microcystin-dependent protein